MPAGSSPQALVRYALLNADSFWCSDLSTHLTSRGWALVSSICFKISSRHLGELSAGAGCGWLRDGAQTSTRAPQHLCRCSALLEAFHLGLSRGFASTDGAFAALQGSAALCTGSALDRGCCSFGHRDQASAVDRSPKWGVSGEGCEPPRGIDLLRHTQGVYTW